MENFFSKNMRFLRNSRGLNQERFAKEIGIKRTTLANYETGKSKPDFENLIGLAKLFGISIADLVEHDLCKKLNEAASYAENDVVNKVEEETVPLISRSKGIPYYDVDVLASNVSAFDSTEFINGYVIVPGMSKCDYALPVSGHSMEPLISNGDIILCNQISDNRLINYGEVYLVIQGDLRVVKYVRKGEGDKLILISQNKEFDTFELIPDDTLRLFSIKAVIKKLSM